MHTSRCDGPSRCELSRPAPRPRRTVSHLADASYRAGDTPGLTDLLRYLGSESEIGATVIVGAYFVCIAFFTRSAMRSSARFSCLDVRSRDHSPPCDCQPRQSSGSSPRTRPQRPRIASADGAAREPPAPLAGAKPAGAVRVRRAGAARRSPTPTLTAPPAGAARAARCIRQRRCARAAGTVGRCKAGRGGAHQAGSRSAAATHPYPHRTASRSPSTMAPACLSRRSTGVISTAWTPSTAPRRAVT